MKKKNFYITNEELIPELQKYNNTGKISNELGGMIYKIAKNLSNKGRYLSLSWKDDMIQEALLTCCKYVHNFKLDIDPKTGKNSNAFSYITTICANAFSAYNKKQKKHSLIKDLCYKEINKLEENQSVWVEKGIDYSVLVKDKKKEDLPNLQSERIYK